jgi:hypothetical protein
MRSGPRPTHLTLAWRAVMRVRDGNDASAPLRGLMSPAARSEMAAAGYLSADGVLFFRGLVRRGAWFRTRSVKWLVVEQSEAGVVATALRLQVGLPEPARTRRPLPISACRLSSQGELATRRGLSRLRLPRHHVTVRLNLRRRYGLSRIVDAPDHSALGIDARGDLVHRLGAHKAIYPSHTGRRLNGVAPNITRNARDSRLRLSWSSRWNRANGHPGSSRRGGGLWWAQ